MEATVNGKADAWRSRIDDQRVSGQSVRAWCQANDAREHSFYWWRARLGLSPDTRRFRRPSKSIAFTRVVVHPSAAEPLRLRFAGGRELILPASISLEQVARLIHAVEATA